MTRRSLLIAAAHLLAISAVIVFLGAWAHALGDVAAAYRVYHRARVEHDAGRATARDVCETSRRCCDAQCASPFADPDDACRRHLERVAALGPSGREGRDRDVLRAYRAEAELWVERGRFKSPVPASLRKLLVGSR